MKVLTSACSGAIIHVAGAVAAVVATTGGAVDSRPSRCVSRDVGQIMIGEQARPKSIGSCHRHEELKDDRVLLVRLLPDLTFSAIVYCHECRCLSF